jgi:predicted DNA-binding transcriptional regulator YafY
MSVTLLRQWTLLKNIPRAPHTIEIGALITRLKAAGLMADKRTVQRDLTALARVFPLHADDRTPTRGWSWSADAPTFDLPAMDAPTALSVRTIEEILQTQLPPGLGAALAPDFARARAVLEAGEQSSGARTSHLVRVVPLPTQVALPELNQAVTRTVYQALLDGKMLAISYAPPTPELDCDYSVNPLGLMVRGSVIYLVCLTAGHQDIRQLLLHRIKSAAMTDTVAVRPADFDLAGYLDWKDSQLPVEPMIQLKVKINRIALTQLHETPLSSDQSIDESGPEHLLVTATVRDSNQLASWLLGFGEHAEVIKPESVRQKIERSQRMAAQQYIRR